jgi:membrane associated rhomboid family serine protease
MLDDRSYMRSESYQRYWSATIVLLIINAAIFVLQQIFNLTELFALSLDGLAKGYIWQLVTFQFLHGGLFHLLVNLLIIYFFGRALEEVLGRKSFLVLYLGSGVIGGLFEILFGLVFPGPFAVYVVGASAGALGLIAAFAAMFPERQLTLLLFFVIPISMRAKTLLWISLALALFGIIAPYGGIAHAAHLGGIFAGLAYVFCIVQGHGLRFFVTRSGGTRQERQYANVTSVRRPNWRRSPTGKIEDLPSAEFISKEVDPILDKISAHGIHSLTDEERRVLEAARAKMSRR